MKNNFLKCVYLKSLKDNYIWIILDNKKNSVIIDPGDSNVVMNYVIKNKINPIAILLTHDHNDHIDGAEFISNYFNIPIYSYFKKSKYKLIEPLKNKTSINLLNNNFKILYLPGHTKNHVAFYVNSWLFCGDTLFSGGCGIVQGNMYKEMYNSLIKIKKLPENTLIYSGHEYTLKNLQFSKSILFNDRNILNYINTIKNIISFGKPTYPTCLFIEKKINLFLRCDYINKLLFNNFYENYIVFKILRKKKDKFNNKF
ncbi:MAG: hydroxyacylglutathione hydrolase [Enterobacteriaceae bacterium]